jgi:protein-tyrosine phosphatase
VDFVEGMKDRIKGILVHCEAGQSRSAAVAAVIELVLNGSDERIFQDRRYSPNQYVYSKLLFAWQKRAKKRSDPPPCEKDRSFSLEILPT